MKKDLSIVFGLFAIVAAVIIYQGASGGALLPGSKKTATSEATMNPTGSQADTPINTNLATTQVKILRLKVEAEVADTMETRAIGLGGRESLSDGQGMLFVFDSEAKHSFWMKNVKFGLDIIWMDGNKKVVHFVKNTLPDHGGNLEIYTPPQKAKYVLEVNGGSIDKFGVELGNKASFDLKK